MTLDTTTTGSALATMTPEALARIHDAEPPAGSDGYSSRGDLVVPRDGDEPTSGLVSRSGELTRRQQAETV